MKRIAFTAVGLAAGFFAMSPTIADDKVARGKYIVSTAACHDCHTPWILGP
jgi:hypothetical protein